MRGGKILMMFVVLSLVGRADAAQKPAAEEHIRGNVVAVKGHDLEVKTPAGQPVTVALPDHVPVARTEKAGVNDIQSGAFVGVTAVPGQNGTLRAVEVHVFPESMRGTGEGSRPWDVRQGSSMTNGTVASANAGSQPTSTMTNGTVGNVAGTGTSRTIDVKYGGEEKKVVVSPSTPVVKLEPGDRSGLKPGEHVFVIAQKRPDGTLLAQRIMFGEGQNRPPM